jgi:biotin carboxyl carrier protein
MAKHLRITVEGKAYDVVVEDLTEDAGSTFYQTPSVGMAPAAPIARAPAAAAAAAPVAPAAAGGPDDKLAPLAGVIVEVAVKVGDKVNQGDKVVVIEAMKMKTTVTAHKAGTVASIAVKTGDAVDAGQSLLTIS